MQHRPDPHPARQPLDHTADQGTGQTANLSAGSSAELVADQWSDGASDRRGWWVVVPVKCTAFGKSRLADFAGPARPQLAFAFALDTVAAAMAAPSVARVLVVTSDGPVSAAAAQMGAVVVRDPDQGLNAAYRIGAQAAPADARIAGLQGDLPALIPSDLTQALDLCAGYESAFVADAHGIGTTLYAASSATVFRPHFGGHSRRAHTEAGAHELDLGFAALASLRRDVDTGDDLRAAQQLGLGQHTSAALQRLHGHLPGVI